MLAGIRHHVRDVLELEILDVVLLVLPFEALDLVQADIVFVIVLKVYLIDDCLDSLQRLSRVAVVSIDALLRHLVLIQHHLAALLHQVFNSVLVVLAALFAQSEVADGEVLDGRGTVGVLAISVVELVNLLAH